MNSSEKRNNFTVGFISIVILVALVFLCLKLAEDSHRQRMAGSYSRRDDGYYGIYLLIKKQFPHAVSRNGRRLDRFFSGKPVVLITTRNNWTEQEQKAARGWMERGGVLVMLNPPEEEQGPEASARRAQINSAWTGFTDLPRLHIPESKVWLATDTDQPLYRSTQGPEVGVRATGRGRRVVFSSSTLLTNGYLRRHPEAGAALVKLVTLYYGSPLKKIVWDESITTKPEVKPSQIPGWWYALLTQLALLAIVFTVSRGRRLGPPVELAQDQSLSLGDYLNSLAGFYRKTGARQVVLEELYHDVRRRLLRATGCGAGVSDRELAEAYGQIRGWDPSALSRTLEEAAAAITHRDPGEKAFFAMGKALDNYRKELDKYD